MRLMKLLLSNAIVSGKLRITGFGLAIVAVVVLLLAVMEAILLFRAPIPATILNGSGGILAVWKTVKGIIGLRASGISAAKVPNQ